MIMNNNVVYLKEFENGKLYIGVTNNFKRRMAEHELDSKNKNKSAYNNKIYKAMRKYKHTTKILINTTDYEETLKYESLVIKNFKDLGYEIYNMTNGGQGGAGREVSQETRDKLSESRKGIKPSLESRIKMREAQLGSKNHNFGKPKSEETKRKLSISHSKPKEYYSTKTTTRSDFKKICSTQKWKIEDFEEKFIEWHVKPCGGRSRKFLYILKK